MHVQNDHLNTNPSTAMTRSLKWTGVRAKGHYTVSQFVSNSVLTVCLSKSSYYLHTNEKNTTRFNMCAQLNNCLDNLELELTPNSPPCADRINRPY